jgi:hypothetical protein
MSDQTDCSVSAHRSGEPIIGRQEFSVEAFGERHVRRVIAVEIIPQFPDSFEQWPVPMNAKWKVLVILKAFCGPICGQFLSQQGGSQPRNNFNIAQGNSFQLASIGPQLFSDRDR